MRSMRDEEVREFVKRNRFGILGLANGGHAYALPLFYGYDGQDLYFHTHPGLKVEFIQATAEACFTIARVVSLDDWASVQAFGHIERAGTWGDLAAQAALMSVPLPPQWGESSTGEPRRDDHSALVYRLRPVRIEGRYSAPPRASGESLAYTGA